MAIETTDDSTRVIKRGETCIQATLSRGSGGLTISVQVHPRVEEFFRTIGTGEPDDVRKYGRFWTNVEKDKPLMVYNMNQPLSVLPLSNGKCFRLDRPGAAMMESSGELGNKYGANDIINLSFLRLAGASGPDGVTFKVNGVHTEQAIRQMRDLIGEAAQSFYVNYLRPIDFVVQVSTQDIPR